MTSPTPTQKLYYTEDIDFQQLATQDADFAAILAQNNGRIDWQDPNSLQQLTKSLLKRDFNLTISLPLDRLCPPVPVRWNYIRWLQDLLATTSPSYTETFSSTTPVQGLDIGTGASAIYSLLASATAPAWRLYSSDIDAHSLCWANRNVSANALTDRIHIVKVDDHDGPLVPLNKLGVKELDFVVCNPPFYSSEDDMRAAYGAKAMPPSAVCTGSTNEMIAPGGDFGFVSRIIDESLILRERVRWYTAMLGRMASLQQVVAKLKQHGVGNFAVVNLSAGQKTRRWGIGWSFRGERARNDVGRCGGLVQGVLPHATEWTIGVEGVGKGQVGERVRGVMGGLDLKWVWREGVGQGLAVAGGNVWSRAARRKRKFGQRDVQMGEEGEGGSGSEDEEVALAVKITCADERVDVRWLSGSDSVLWESFCGMLKRAIGAKGKSGAKMEE